MEFRTPQCNDIINFVIQQLIRVMQASPCHLRVVIETKEIPFLFEWPRDLHAIITITGIPDLDRHAIPREFVTELPIVLSENPNDYSEIRGAILWKRKRSVRFMVNAHRAVRESELNVCGNFSLPSHVFVFCISHLAVFLLLYFIDVQS